MAGFQNWPYPTRAAFGAPNSQPVQSDAEFANAWDAKVASVPQHLIDNEGVQLIAGAQGYDPTAARPYVDQIYGNTGDAARDQLMADARAYFSFNSGKTDLYGDPLAGRTGASHIVGQTWADNPEYAKVLADRSASEAQRGEAQTRNQQAYDTGLMGNGAVGGVMPSAYGSSTYGQITGQKQGGLGGLGGMDLTGVDNAQQTGAYTGGSGAYNPNPFAPGSFQNKNPWGGF
jgi:hypothetical protein